MDSTILKLFNEKVERLNALSFTKHVRENKIGFTVRSTVDEPVVTELRAPSDESVDAFVLTMRLFLQNNERISIKRIGDLYASSTLPPELKENFLQSRDECNAFLDRSAQIQLNSEVLTNRRILEVMLYGGLAHTNQEKRAVFEEWMANPVLAGMLQFAFHGILIGLLRFLLWAHAHNERVLAHLEGASARPA